MPPKRKRAKSNEQHGRHDSITSTVLPESRHVARRSISEAPSLGNHIICIFAGEDRRLFTLHTEILPTETLQVLYGRTPPHGFCTLTEHGEEAFNLYRLFLYTRTLYSSTDHDKDVDRHGRVVEHEDREWVRITHAYFLGSLLKDESFANAAIDGLLEKVESEEYFPTGLATEVYANTAPGDALRKLIVAFHVWIGQCTCLGGNNEDKDAPAEFFQDIGLALRDAGDAYKADDAAMPWAVDRCQFHIHETTKRCDGRGQVSLR